VEERKVNNIIAIVFLHTVSVVMWLIIAKYILTAELFVRVCPTI